MWARAWPAVVTPTRGHGSGVESIYSLSAGRGERQVETWPGAEHSGPFLTLKSELLVPLRIWRPIPEPPFMTPEPNIPERRQGSIIERRCPSEIADAERNVARHAANMLRSGCRRNADRSARLWQEIFRCV